MGDTAQLEHFKAKARRLEDERDQLRVDLAYEKSTALMLKTENARLRELVAEMYPLAKEYLVLSVQLGYIDSLSYEWQLTMRELGIEV